MDEQELAAIEAAHAHDDATCELGYVNGWGERGCWVLALVAEVRRLRAERDGLKRTQTVNAARVLGPPG